MIAPAKTSLNTPVDGGKSRSRQSWQKWGESRLTKTDKRVGFVCIAGLFSDDNGFYYRINFASQPIAPRPKQRFKL